MAVLIECLTEWCSNTQRVAAVRLGSGHATVQHHNDLAIWEAVFVGFHEGLVVTAGIPVGDRGIAWAPREHMRLCFGAECIPFIALNEPPRPLTVCSNLVQAINIHFATGISVVRSLISNSPLITTDVAAKLSKESGDGSLALSSWRVACYAPHDLNYEDGIALGRGFAGRLGYYAIAWPMEERRRQPCLVQVRLARQGFTGAP